MKSRKVLVYIVLLIVAAGALLLWWQVMDPRGQPVAGVLDGPTLVLRDRDLERVDSAPEQTHLAREGQLRLSVLPDQPPPTPAERGVRVIVSADRAATLNDHPVVVEIRYGLSRSNPASGLAVSLQGIGPAHWVSEPLTADAATVRFELPEQSSIYAIGLRALSDKPGRAGVVTINEIRITPLEDAD